ncbi:molybdate ABC transporter permease subunit [Aliikangiella sp. IMCC44653]
MYIDVWQAVLVTLKLATLVTLILLVLCTPAAWWLAHTRAKIKPVVLALVAMPLILPPTVLGFYLLMLLGPQGPIGEVFQFFGWSTLPFSFAGLVVASIFYSLPFVMQPIYNAFCHMGSRPLEVAATLGAGPVDRFFSVALPLAKPGFIAASILGFSHTVGEFGVVLMIGGNIPGETQVLSVLLYEQVESLNYAKAHYIAAGLIGFALLTLVLLFSVNLNAFKLNK